MGTDTTRSCSTSACPRASSHSVSHASDGRIAPSAAADSLYVTDDFLVTHNTLNDAFIILDEAQNTTPEQMKMFLTRLGFGSKAVVTGDVTQVDLPEGKKSGLREAREILRNVEGIRFFEFGDKDVVRHPLVGKIVVAYDRAERERKSQP